jgi:hypothetical protein
MEYDGKKGLTVQDGANPKTPPPAPIPGNIPSNLKVCLDNIE